MIWIKSFHIIFVITWFAGLFYLPRLFVYHAMAEDAISIERFKIMERKLYYGIMMPGAVLATGFGIWMICLAPAFYLSALWMHIKLLMAMLLWVYHIYCGRLVHIFKQDRNCHTHRYYRWLNEVPLIFLVVSVICVVVRPF